MKYYFRHECKERIDLVERMEVGMPSIAVIFNLIKLRSVELIRIDRVNAIVTE